MNSRTVAPGTSRHGFAAALAAGVFLLVLAAQLWLVARAGTDVPFLDQWDVEGGRLYPKWRDGTLGLADLLQPHNEHHIVWTHLLNLALFAVNGQWDPLTQMAAGAVVRAAAVTALAFWLASAAAGRPQALLLGLGVVVAYLPHLAWHNVLWGFQSQVAFSLLFSLVALALLAAPGGSGARRGMGVLAGVAAMLAMGSGILTPAPLLGLAAVRAIEGRAWVRLGWRELWPALALAGAAWGLSRHGAESATLQPHSVADFFAAFGRMLAWPHVDQPLAALAMNLPLAWTVVERLVRRRAAAPGEDFILTLGGWALAVGAAAAWARGGAAELAAGVPSRYVDFVVLLPLANILCLPGLLRRATAQTRVMTRALVMVWAVFLGIGWVGLSLQMTRRILVPRIRDQAAPVRLMQAFARTGDAAVFEGQPRLLVPHSNLEVVRSVLADPRLRGSLPPSLQPQLPPGPLSRGVRGALGLSGETSPR